MGKEKKREVSQWVKGNQTKLTDILFLSLLKSKIFKTSYSSCRKKQTKTTITSQVPPHNPTHLLARGLIVQSDGEWTTTLEHKAKIPGCRDQSSLVRRLGVVDQLVILSRWQHSVTESKQFEEFNTVLQ